jgi:VanZ family protein
MAPKTSTQKLPAKLRLAALVLALLWAALIFVLSGISGQNYPAHPGFLNYVAHGGEYLILAALIHTALYNGKADTWKLAMITIIIVAVYAASDELHQLFVPYRSSDVVDWLCDLGGGVLGTFVSMLFLRFWLFSCQRHNRRKDNN